MGLRNWWRVAKGSRARGVTKSVELALAQKIPDNNRDRPEVTTVETLARLIGAGETRTRRALKELAELGELKRSHTSGAKDSYQILWAALKPPDESEPDYEHEDYEARHTSTAPLSRSGSSVSGSVPATDRRQRVARVRQARRTGAESASPVRTLKGLKADKGAPSAAGAGGAVASSPTVVIPNWMALRIGEMWGVDQQEAAARFNPLPDSDKAAIVDRLNAEKAQRDRERSEDDELLL